MKINLLKKEKNLNSICHSCVSENPAGNKVLHTAGSSGLSRGSILPLKNKGRLRGVFDLFKTHPTFPYALREGQIGRSTSTCHPCESGDLMRFPVKRGMTEKCGHFIPSLSLRGGFANEAISCRLPRPIGLAMTGECGHSMVEMLGVLAVMGVLSVAGISGYNAAVIGLKNNDVKKSPRISGVIFNIFLIRKTLLNILANRPQQCVLAPSYRDYAK